MPRIARDSKLAFGDPTSSVEYAVIGTATAFYVWARDAALDCPRGAASHWIRGREAFSAFQALREVHRKGDRLAFVAAVTRLYDGHRKDPCRAQPPL